MKKLMIGFAVVLSGAISAAEYAVKDIPRAMILNDVDGIISASDAIPTTWPESVPTPTSFWFDSSRTNGWEFTIYSGALSVTKIPSLVGDGRFLTTDTTLEGTTFTGWNGTAIRPPTFVTAAEDTADGIACVDFGKLGSKMALLFNPHDYGEKTGHTTSNVLWNIGSVVMVYGSQNGGGWLMGGGFGSAYDWHRMSDRTEVAKTDNINFIFHTPVFADPSLSNLKNGVVRHDGLATRGERIGFSGGWETITWLPKAADDAATYSNVQATGLGMGDGRGWTGGGRSGGMKIAEFMVFEEPLTIAQAGELERYLAKKWFNGRAAVGYDGTTRVGELVVKTNDWMISGIGLQHTFINTPANERLEVGHIYGGRGKKPALEKKGAGTLALSDARGYSGDIKVTGGTLELPARAIPTGFAVAPWFHFDASDASSYEVQQEEGLSRLTLWRNTGSATFYTQPYCLRPSGFEIAKAPIFRENLLGAGLNVVDFGALTTHANGRSLMFCTNETITTSKAGPFNAVDIGTVMAVIGAHQGGGNLMSDEFCRSSPASVTYRKRLLYATASHGASPTNGVLYINGLKRNASQSGYAKPGWQVVAFTTGTGLSPYLGTTTSYAGGFQLAEIVMWNRALTEQEILDAQAYLAKKWLNRSLAGYTDAADESMPAIQKVTIDGASAITVSGAGEKQIGALAVNTPIEKRGAGTLVVEAFTNKSSVTVKEGALRISAPKDVSAKCEIAAGAALHLDACETNAMCITEAEVGGVTRKCIRVWEDLRTGEGAERCDVISQPFLNETDTLNGHPVVDFGPFEFKSANATYKRCMYLSRAFHSVQAAFVVWGAQEGGGVLLGSVGGVNEENVDVLSERLNDTDSWEQYRIDFSRNDGQGVPETTPFIRDNEACKIITDGAFFTNGIPVNPLVDYPAKDWMLVESYPVAGAHVSALAVDRGYQCYGGQRLAEVILYERPLSAREKVATRNYLMKKWFGKTDAELEDLPAADSPTTQLGDVRVESGATLDVAAGCLEITDFKNLENVDGEFSVSNATVAITRPLPEVEAITPPAEGLTAHFDATLGVALDGTSNRICAWTNLVSGGSVVQAIPGWTDSEDNYPTLESEGLNNLPIVKMKPNNMGSGNYIYSQFLRFADAAGTPVRLDDIRTVIWVIGSQDGGGFVLGGGDAGYAFHRDIRKGDYVDMTNATCGVTYSAAMDCVNYGTWYLNSVATNNSMGLSGNWDVLAMVVNSAMNPSAANADGFAFDGRVTKESYYNNKRSGCQRLAEVLIYNRIIHNEERRGIEAYLQRKWGFTQVSETNNAAITVQKTGVLDCGGFKQYVASLSGCGAVQNGALSVGELAAGAAPTVTGDFTFAEGATWHVAVDENGAVEKLNVSGTLTFAGALNLDITGLAALGKLSGKSIVLARALKYAGLTNHCVAFTQMGDEISPNIAMVLRVNAAGDLVLSFHDAGLKIFIR